MNQPETYTRLDILRELIDAYEIEITAGKIDIERMHKARLNIETELNYIEKFLLKSDDCEL
ncbi:hypothetical protein [Massilibacteroides sp.]|uniref:hypothetical protein n=1 Tax=Massilibacteroides sp. TaxID=2034766 RepID=UPI00260A5F92|nr:hypothetical protein [Massilibacteroides sp.]MDD4515689.1 hypothetical protein [Massilibacteroides sp.]